MIRCNLKSILEDRQISINKLSSATGVSRQSITALVNNDSKGIQFNTLDKLIEFLGIRIEDIIEYTDSYKQFYIKLDVVGQNNANEFKNSVLDSGILTSYKGFFILENTTESKLYYCSFSLWSTYVGASLNTYTICHLDHDHQQIEQNKDLKSNFVDKDLEFNTEKIEQFLSVLPNLDEIAHTVLNALLVDSYDEYERYSHSSGAASEKYKTNKEGIFSFEFSLMNSKKNPVFNYETNFDRYIHLEPSSFKNNDNLSILFNEFDL